MPSWPEKRTRIGAHTTRIDAAVKVTGAAKYSSDVQPQGWLYGMILRSRWPKARVAKIDLAEALKIPGIKAAVLDREGERTVRYYGEELAAVAGTSNSPYATLYAQNNSTGVYTFIVVPVVAGSFTGTLTLPASNPGDQVNLEVWGSLANYTNFNDPNYYDNGAYFNQNQNVPLCSDAPTLGHGALAVLMFGLVLAGRIAIRRSAKRRAV